MVKNKLIIINIVLLFISFLGISQTLSDTLKKSLNNEYDLLIITKNLSDNTRELKYLLSSIEKKDTFELITCLRKDLPNPNIFFDLKNNYLIYEDNDYGTNSYLRVLDLDTKKTIFSTKGFIPIPDKYLEDFFDKKNNVLFFYKVEQVNNQNMKTFLMKLDIEKLEVKEISILKINFQFEYPIVEINNEGRKVKIKYVDEVSENNPLIYEDEYNY